MRTSNNNISIYVIINYLLANDLKLYYNVYSIDDSIKIQNDLNSLRVRCNRNGLKLNKSMCVKMSFYRFQIKFNYNYFILSDKLKEVNNVKDLEVIFQ